MRGRKPTPTRLKILRGNPGRRKLREDELTPAQGIPLTPELLSGAARVEWDRLVKQLAPSGVLTVVDGGALAVYCASLARWRQADAELDRMLADDPAAGSTVEFGRVWRRSRQAADQILRFGVEFGLTPSSRSRVSRMPTAETGKSRWDEFRR